MDRFYYYLPIILQKVGFIVFYLLHKFFVQIEILGKENLIGLKKPIIIASNHTSELDVTITPIVLGFFSKHYPIYYVTNPREKYTSFGWRNYIYGGVFFNILGGYPIHSGFKDYETSLENFIDLLDDNQTIFIFPEGKRSVNGELNPPRGGLGFLVHETHATVVPIAINTFYNMNWREYFLRKRKVVIEILKPLTPEDLIRRDDPAVEDYRGISEIVLNEISIAIGKQKIEN
jgi:1-acyl-sn-glycerol-3-phosphate acyltransferase